MPDDSSTTAYSDAFFAAQSAGSLSSARAVLREAFGLLGTPASVVDVGCGVGTWLRAAAELGAGAVLGLDGDWVPRGRLEIPEDRFVSCDLACGGPARAGVSGPFDLVMSLEVAEHLPASRAGAFVETLCGLGDAVLFSAALPHQGGVDHVNEDWPMAWGALFAARGFECFDALRPRVWLSPEVEWWYAQNVFVFARNGAAERMRRACPASPVALPLVHPRRYLLQTRAEADLLAALREACQAPPLAAVPGRTPAELRAEAKADALRLMLARARAGEGVAADHGRGDPWTLLMDLQAAHDRLRAATHDLPERLDRATEAARRAEAEAAALSAELAEARRDAEAARAEARRAAGAAEAEAARAGEEAAALRAEVQALRNSSSWRVTKPVRKAVRLLRREPDGP
jgi:SAM-dependent methyltransferase